MGWAATVRAGVVRASKATQTCCNTAWCRDVLQHGSVLQHVAVSQHGRELGLQRCWLQAGAATRRNRLATSRSLQHAATVDCGGPGLGAIRAREPDAGPSQARVGRGVAIAA